jgi:hypothetical protein
MEDNSLPTMASFKYYPKAVKKKKIPPTGNHGNLPNQVPVVSLSTLICPLVSFYLLKHL